MTLATSSVLGAQASVIGSELSVYLAPVLFLALIHERPRRSVTGSSSVQFYDVELGCSEVSALRRPPTMVSRYAASLKATTVCRTPVSQVSRATASAASKRMR